MAFYCQIPFRYLLCNNTKISTYFQNNIIRDLTTLSEIILGINEVFF